MLVYLGTNTRTGQRYVGVTAQTLRKRLAEHRCKANKGGAHLLHQAIREHGWSAFRWDVIAECGDRDLLFLAEREAVDKFKTHASRGGYNMTVGGSGVAGFSYSAESRAKLARAMRGRVVSDETRLKLSAANKGKRPTEDCIAAIKATPWTVERRAKLSAAKAGRPTQPRSEATREKIRAVWRRRKAEGDRLIKIPRGDLQAVLARKAAGESFRAIAESYGCSPSAVFLFVKGAT
jgi:group I intron endonuclease